MSMIHDITASVPRNKRAKREGRGESSGHGKTCGRGNKGSGARGGKYIRSGYEGGQTEIYKRLPQRGFSNAQWETRYNAVNVGDLDVFDAGATVDMAALKEKGLIPNSHLEIKVLGDGELKKRLTVQAGWYTKSAHEKIVAAGGSALTTKGKTFEFPKPKKKFVVRVVASKKTEANADAPATA